MGYNIYSSGGFLYFASTLIRVFSLLGISISIPSSFELLMKFFLTLSFHSVCIDHLMVYLIVHIGFYKGNLIFLFHSLFTITVH